MRNIPPASQKTVWQDFKDIVQIGSAKLLGAPFTFTYTSGRYSVKKFVASYDGELFVNCRFATNADGTEDNSIIIVCVDYKALPAPSDNLHVKREWRVSDTDFTDGYQNVVVEDEVEPYEDADVYSQVVINAMRGEPGITKIEQLSPELKAEIMGEQGPTGARGSLFWFADSPAVDTENNLRYRLADVTCDRDDAGSPMVGDVVVCHTNCKIASVFLVDTEYIYCDPTNVIYTRGPKGEKGAEGGNSETIMTGIIEDGEELNQKQFNERITDIVTTNGTNFAQSILELSGSIDDEETARKADTTALSDALSAETRNRKDEDDRISDAVAKCYVKPEGGIPVSDFSEEARTSLIDISGKVDKVEGKGLSSNDYTTTEKNKLRGIESGAQVNTVESVCGRTGKITLTKADVGLNYVTNESKASILNSAALTGIPTAPTASAGTSSIQIANTSYVMAAIAQETQARTLDLSTMHDALQNNIDDLEAQMRTEHQQHETEVYNDLASLRTLVTTETNKREEDIDNITGQITHGIGTTNALVETALTTESESLTNAVSPKAVVDYVREQIGISKAATDILVQANSATLSNHDGKIDALMEAIYGKTYAIEAEEEEGSYTDTDNTLTTDGKHAIESLGDKEGCTLTIRMVNADYSSERYTNVYAGGVLFGSWKENTLADGVTITIPANATLYVSHSETSSVSLSVKTMGLSDRIAKNTAAIEALTEALR